MTADGAVSRARHSSWMLGFVVRQSGLYMASLINVRRLAALDLVFHGARLVVFEFALGVLLPLAVGIWTLLRTHSRFGLGFGLYMIAIGVNYIPLLLHAISITHRRRPSEYTDEFSGEEASARKYGIQSFLLLVPLVLPVLALVQLRGHRR